MTLQEAVTTIIQMIRESGISETAKWLLLTAIERSEGFTRPVVIIVSGYPIETLDKWTTEIWQLFRRDDCGQGVLDRFIRQNRLPVNIGSYAIAGRPLHISIGVIPEDVAEQSLCQLHVIGPEAEVATLPEEIML